MITIPGKPTRVIGFFEDEYGRPAHLSDIKPENLTDDEKHEMEVLWRLVTELRISYDMYHATFKDFFCERLLFLYNKMRGECNVGFWT